MHCQVAIQCRTPLEKEKKKVSAQAPRDRYTSLDQVLDQPGATHAQIQETAHTFFLPLYGQKGCTTMNGARAHFYRSRAKGAHFYRGHKKPPPTEETSTD